MKIRKLITSTAVAAWAIVSLQGNHVPNHLERVKARGELVAISRNGPTTYFQTEEGYAGFDYQLLQQFADTLDVSLRIIDEPIVDHLYDRVGDGIADLGAASLAINESRLSQVRYSDQYRTAKPVLIYRTGQKKPKSLNELSDRNVHVIGGRSHEQLVKEIQSLNPSLNIVSHNELEMIDLLEQVHKGEIGLAIVDEASFHLNHVLFPRTRVALDIDREQPVAWAFKPGKDLSLYNAANQFLQDSAASGMLGELATDFYQPDDMLNKASASLFVKRIDERLPKYQPLFQQAADTYGLSWEFIAAVAYQESHWNPAAVSRTGVRGMMMLTQNTAKEMNISKRTDAAQSVDGGVRYLLKLKKRLPKRIAEPDRTFLALAAYNIGHGHLEDARVLTERAGLNPDNWVDVKKHLPLLQKSQYYRTVKYGFARGSEPVTYVERIRSFERALAWSSKMQQRNDSLQQVASNDQAAKQESVLALF